MPTLTRTAPGVLQVDARRGFAPLAFEVGRDALAETAREQGIAALGINGEHHFAALWPEVEYLAERGLVAFAFVSAFSYVAPAGGRERNEAFAEVESWRQGSLIAAALAACGVLIFFWPF